MTIVSNHKISRLTALVNTLDPNAFMVVEEAYKVLGEGFTPISREAVDHLEIKRKR